MFASVHSDRASRVLVSQSDGAAGLAGEDGSPVLEAIPLPEGSRLVALPREALAIGRDGRAHAFGRDRLALGALLPRGYVRLLCPAYRDDPSVAALEALPYAAVAAGPEGEPFVAAARLGDGGSSSRTGRPALRSHPSNALARQLGRCARDNACAAAAVALGGAELPVPLGAPPAERPVANVALRSGYDGAPHESPAFRPSAREIVEIALAHLTAGGGPVSFGRACDGEPLARGRVIEECAGAIRDKVAGADLHIETAGGDPVALRRCVEAGVGSVTIRLGSARGDTYERLHGSIAHRWSDVRASLTVAAERARLTVALLLLPGLTDRPEEIDAISTLLGELPGGQLELRDLGCDPLRTVARFPRGRAAGMRALLDRLAEADHFHVP